MIVWGIGSEGDQRLHGFDGDTGAVDFHGGGANELMAGTRRFNTAIAARGRIYVANDNKVYAFTVPVAPIVLTNLTLLPGGAFQFGFTNVPGHELHRVWHDESGAAVHQLDRGSAPLRRFRPASSSSPICPGPAMRSVFTASRRLEGPVGSRVKGFQPHAARKAEG